MDRWGKYIGSPGSEPLNRVLRRSMLIVPANMRRYVESATRTESDAVLLDLEDSIPPSEKLRARSVLKEDVNVLRGGGSTILVRVNRDFELCLRDIEVAVQAGVDGIRFSGAGKSELEFLDRFLSHLEIQVGLPLGALEISTSIETPLALFQVQEIVAASDRLVSIGFSTEDMAAELGIRATNDGLERLLGNAMVVMAAATRQVLAMGLLGNVANYTDLELFEESAVRAAAFGFQGAAAIHPNQVPILNEAFSPSEDDVAFARQVIDALDADPTRGSAAVSGKMVDIATARRAERILRRRKMIDDIAGRSS